MGLSIIRMALVTFTMGCCIIAIMSGAIYTVFVCLLTTDCVVMQASCLQVI